MRESRPDLPRTSPRSVAALLVALGPCVLFAPFALGACAATGAGEPAAEASEGATDEKEEKTVEERKVELAELRLETARSKSEKDLAEARVKAELAERKLEEARRKLAVFKSTRKAIRTDEARLELDRSIGRANDARAELAELEAMYAEEEFAELTKELVITRGRRNLEHAQRAVAIRETKLDDLTSEELPAEERELQRAVFEAEGAVDAAHRAIQIAELEGRVAVGEAELKLEEARKKAEEDES